VSAAHAQPNSAHAHRQATEASREAVVRPNRSRAALPAPPAARAPRTLSRKTPTRTSTAARTSRRQRQAGRSWTARCCRAAGILLSARREQQGADRVRAAPDHLEQAPSSTQVACCGLRLCQPERPARAALWRGAARARAAAGCLRGCRRAGRRPPWARPPPAAAPEPAAPAAAAAGAAAQGFPPSFQSQGRAASLARAHFTASASTAVRRSLQSIACAHKLHWGS